MVIVKRCVDLHNGKIELASGLGKGTKVTVRLPLFNPDTRKRSRLKTGLQRRPRGSKRRAGKTQ
jgi:hypothetical protein